MVWEGKTSAESFSTTCSAESFSTTCSQQHHHQQNFQHQQHHQQPFQQQPNFQQNFQQQPHFQQPAQPIIVQQPAQSSGPGFVRTGANALITAAAFRFVGTKIVPSESSSEKEKEEEENGKGKGGENGAAELRETQTPEWTRLFLEKTAVNSRPLAAVDSNIKDLLEDIRLPWTAILENMSVVYPKHVRTLPPCSLNGPLHVLVINPANTDHMLRFSIGLSAAQCISVEAFSLSREGVTDISEYTHIDDVFNSILFYLWSNSCFG
ncbi:hypothetical protein BASA50_003707 [Batrachochytrium salamandrivorans]|uniref:Uncharacterized protein n=1 Tax=Batrachochytrium salamandrivorans TaxID=1357716 RepID=A0ABQ8FI76_9FUNG|nr:hypothetical protein BASA50_003707 [Batrachochytrium salamandrivorans]